MYSQLDKNLDSKVIKLCLTPSWLQKELGSDAKYISLSGWTLRTHTHHSNVDSFDYSLVGDMLESGYKVKHSRDRHIVYFSKLGYYYKAIFKVTHDKQEIYLLSLIKGSKKM